MDHKTVINMEELLIRIEKSDFLPLLPDHEDTDGLLKNIYKHKIIKHWRKCTEII